MDASQASILGHLHELLAGEAEPQIGLLLAECFVAVGLVVEDAHGATELVRQPRRARQQGQGLHRLAGQRSVVQYAGGEVSRFVARWLVTSRQGGGGVGP